MAKAGGRAGGGGGAGAAGAALEPEQGINSGTIGNMTEDQIRDLPRSVQAEQFAQADSTHDARGDALRRVNQEEINRPNDGRYVATTSEYQDFMRTYGTSAPGRQAERDADRLNARRDGSLSGERGYLRDTVSFANRMTANPSVRNLRRLSRTADALEDINNHNAAHVLRTRGALAATQMGRK